MRDEARRNRIAGVAALAAVISSFVVLVLLISATTSPDDGEARQLLDAKDNEGTLLAATVVRAAGWIVIAFVAAHLVDLVRARIDVPGWVRPLAFAAPVALAVTAVLSHLALLDAADAFLASGPRTDGRAEDLLRDGGLQRASGVAAVVLSVPFAGWLAYASLAAAKAGLLTNTLGYWGVGAGIAFLVLPLAGQGLVLGWLGSLGVLLLGWWPGGRGGSWETGDATPWDPGRARGERA